MVGIERGQKFEMQGNCSRFVKKFEGDARLTRIVHHEEGWREILAKRAAVAYTLMKGGEKERISAGIASLFQPIRFVESSLSQVIPTEVPTQYREPRPMIRQVR
jgi:hypothetical protein